MTPHLSQPRFTKDELDIELARQNESLAQARRQLEALGNITLSVKAEALLAIDEACLVRTSTLTSTALRG